MELLSKLFTAGLSFWLGACAAGVDAAEPELERSSYESADFYRVADDVRRLADKHSPDEVLLVLDVDNTLLAMDQDLGSDQWFGWQRNLQRTEPSSPYLVAPDFEGLLEAQGILFALSRMHPPDPALPDTVSGLQDLGVKTIVLTSRGPNFRDATERELVKNGYNFATGALSIAEERGPFLPFDPTSPEQHGLTVKSASLLGGKLRAVSYSHGVFMVAGQHKGYMLRSLLARAVDERGERAFQPKAIVFVDDRKRHVDDVQSAYSDSSLDLVLVRYSREDGNVERFRRADKRRVGHDWNCLEENIRRVLPRREDGESVQSNR